MKLSVFKEIVGLLKASSEAENAVYKIGIDLINFNDPINCAISHLIGATYGNEGKDIFEWWCYEKEWGTRKDLDMISSEGELLCDTIEDLHKYLEDNIIDDYEIKIPLSLDERMDIIKQIFKKD